MNQSIKNWLWFFGGLIIAVMVFLGILLLGKQSPQSFWNLLMLGATSFLLLIYLVIVIIGFVIGLFLMIKNKNFELLIGSIILLLVFSGLSTYFLSHNMSKVFWYTLWVLLLPLLFLLFKRRF